MWFGIEQPVGALRVIDESLDSFRDFQVCNFVVVIVEGKLIRKSVLNACWRPEPKVWFLLFHHVQIGKSGIPIVFDDFSILIITILQRKWLIRIFQAAYCQRILYCPSIIRRLKYKHGGLQKLYVITRVQAINNIKAWLTQTFSYRHRHFFSAINQIKQINGSISDQLLLCDLAVVISNKEPTVWDGINLGSFCIIHQIVTPLISGHSSSRNTCDYDGVSVVEIVLLVHIAELLEDVPASSEIEVDVFILNGIFSISQVLRAITVYNEDFGPIIEYGIFLLQVRQQSLLGEAFLRLIVFSRSKTTRASSVAQFNRFRQRASSTESSTVKIHHKFIFVGSSSLMNVQARRRTIQTGRPSFFGMKYQVIKIGLRKDELQYSQQYNQSLHKKLQIGQSNYKHFKMSTTKQSNQKIKIEPTFSQISERQFADVSMIGNYKYYSFYGCMLSEPQKYIGTHILFFVGLLVYFIFSAKYQHPVIITLTIIIYLLIVLDLVFLAFRDPGIIPKILPNYQSEQIKLQQIPIHPHYLKQSQRENIMSTFLYVKKAHFLKMRFCNECCVYRPPRTSHCYDCDVCVQKFDHHCPWVGTCIGKNNYKLFYLFLISSSIFTLFVFCQAINGIAGAAKSSEVVYIVFNSILCLYAFLGLGFVATLLSLHTYLIKNGITTYEYCKDTWDVISGNPFGKQKIVKFREKAYKNFFKMFDYPAIVVSDPEAKFKDRDRMEKQVEATKIKSGKLDDQYKGDGFRVKPFQDKFKQENDVRHKIQKQGITEEDIKVIFEQSNTNT